MVEDIVIQNDEIISVGELNKSAKYLLEHNFSNVSVIGEISNLSRPSSGHIYFTLKDESGAIRCAMFKNQNIKLNFSPENGDQCVLRGQVSIYAARGDYQLIVKSIEPAGAGNLMQKFEVLKKKLEQEGLFDQAKKKIIPSSPKHIAVVTSHSTAAFQDIISTVKRRAPNSQVSLSEAIVQGDAAHVSIINALSRIMNFNSNNPDNLIDVVIVSRGGGSIEDLWCFNNEDLAREIFSYPIPVISGVGHEIDFTICDFVSDLRAPTPSSGAEIISEFYVGIFEELNSKKQLLKKEFLLKLSNLTNSLKLTSKSLVNPKTKLKEDFMKTDEMNNKLKYLLNSFISEKQFLIDKEKLSLKRLNPSDYVKTLKNNNLSLEKNLKTFIKNILNIKSENFKGSIKELEALSPLQILARGYSITKIKSSQKIIRNSKDINIGDIISSVVANSKIESKITKID